MFGGGSTASWRSIVSCDLTYFLVFITQVLQFFDLFVFQFSETSFHAELGLLYFFWLESRTALGTLGIFLECDARGVLVEIATPTCHLD